MKPVAIFRHSPTEGPGHFAAFLDGRNVPWKLVAIDAGEPVPASPDAFAGLVFMGGPMSVNDDLPWIAPVLQLIRDAVAADIPVLGHCLGGQLMSKALGGVVTRNPVKEIGWGAVTVDDHPVAREWFGADVREFVAFHWHGETFSLPPGAVRIMANAHCAHQGFALGPHLAMQCHVEMTPPMIAAWCDSGADEIATSTSPAVQQPAGMQRDVAQRVAALNAVAERLYARWLRGVVS
jgi:GMP synthase-like glutamine amidotransferase